MRGFVSLDVVIFCCIHAIKTNSEASLSIIEGCEFNEYAGFGITRLHRENGAGLVGWQWDMTAKMTVRGPEQSA